MDGNHILTLLQQVTAEQMEDLITEVKLSEQGFRFIYAADTHDIRRFCFPGGFRGNEYELASDGKSINYELVTDIVTGYDELFNFIEPRRPVFLAEEYAAELLNFKNEIADLLSKATLHNYSERFNDYLNKHFQENTNISNDFTLFITIASGLLQTGTIKFNKLIQNENFYVKEFDFANNEGLAWYKSLYEESFRDNYPLYNNIYELLIQYRKPGREINSQLDSEAIARMVEVNKALIFQPENKSLILYFSSVEASAWVFSHIRNQLPFIHDRIFGFHRTVQQIFIQKLYKDLPASNKIERLESIKELSLLREFNAELFIGKNEVADKEYRELEEKVIANVNDAWEKYINANLSRPEQFQRIEELNRQLLKISNNPTYSNLKKLYNFQRR